MTSFSKIGLHGAGTGVGDFMKALDAAGRPFSIKSIANGGYAVEAAKLAQTSGLPHNIILRWPNPNGRGDDHPDLGLDPLDSARELFYGWIEPQINKTPEIQPYKQNIRIEPTNEISTNDNDPSWVGYCLLELGKLLNKAGWPAALGGFNNGQPNKQDWKTPGMRALLEYVGANRQNTITVHEGKTTITNMYQDPETLWPYLIGRFTWILEACNEMGIASPFIEISEWGWAYNDMPEYPAAMEDVIWLAETLARYPAVKAAYLWNLEKGTQWGGLPNKLSAFIPQLQSYNLSATFPDVGDPPPPPPPSGGVNYKVVANLAPPNVTDSQYNQIRLATKAQRETIVQSADDAARLVAPGLPGSKVKVWWPMSWQDDIVHWLINKGVDIVEIQPADQLPRLGLSVPMSGEYTIYSGNKFDAYRNYSWLPQYKQLHEGLDFTPKATGAWVLAPADGVVTAVTYSSQGYGHSVKLRHSSPINFNTYLAHMARVPDVKVGDNVTRGQRIGPVGSSGFSSGEHVHLTVQVPGAGLAGYVVADVVDPWPHMDFSVMPDPGAGEPPPPGTGQALIGLHATADPYMAPGELDVFDTADIRLVKILSNINPNNISELKARISPDQWIVRAYLSMWENGQPRKREPYQFVQDTVSDVRRCIQYIGKEEIWIELHNEPNLTLEGLGGSWGDGYTFAAWYKEVLNLYRQQFPRAYFMFPGMSPGSAITGVRDEKYAFLEGALSAMAASDGIGDHVYWGVGESVYSALQATDRMIQWMSSRGLSSKTLWITEASDKSTDPAVNKGQRYVIFYNGLTGRPTVGGVTYFVASASHPHFQNEVWVSGGKSVGIAEVVGNR